jgi:indolepyruvate ferredoxin oxidoreductase
VADTACTKIYACPSFEEITVVRRQKPPAPIDSIDLDHIPLPKIAGFHDAWRCYLAGVGGQGIGVSTASLVRAGFKQGYHIQFCDKKGLAIRNGSVFSQITFTKGPHHTSNIIPYGQADLLLGIDPLEATRSLSPQGNLRIGSPRRTVAVVNAYKTPTILTLLGKDDFTVAELEATLRRYTKSDEYFGLNVAGISEYFFGTKLYANVVLLGIAFQKGLLPLSLENLEWGLRETMGSAADENIKALHLGRKLVFEPELARKHELRETYEEFIAERKDVLRRNHRKGRRWAREFETLIRRSENTVRLGEQTARDIVWRLYDLLEFGGVGAYAEFYLDLVEKVFAKDSGQFDYAATRAVIWNLHKSLVIKDEIYVAHLLTSEEKTRRDQHRYHVDVSRGDKIVYHHLNRPEFSILGRDVRFKFSPKKWHLNLLKHLRWLRRVMPQWHRRERAFRDWYIRLVAEFRYEDRASYERYVKALRCVEEVRGYREVRYPKMDEARRKAEALLSQPSKAAPVTVSV